MYRAKLIYMTRVVLLFGYPLTLTLIDRPGWQAEAAGRGNKLFTARKKNPKYEGCKCFTGLWLQKFVFSYSTAQQCNFLLKGVA